MALKCAARFKNIGKFSNIVRRNERSGGIDSILSWKRPKT
jgi:hypothetical protein